MNDERAVIFGQMLRSLSASRDYKTWLYKEQRERATMRIVKFLRGEDCEHATKVYKLINTAGVIMYRRRCVKCDCYIGKFIGYKNLTLHETSEAELIQGNSFPVDDTPWQLFRDFASNLWWAAYSEYLSTPEWKSLRQKLLARDGHICQLQQGGCTNRATQAHHLNYTRVGRESLDDLIAVCQNCHSEITAPDLELISQ